MSGKLKMFNMQAMPMLQSSFRATTSHAKLRLVQKRNHHPYSARTKASRSKRRPLEQKLKSIQSFSSYDNMLV